MQNVNGCEYRAACYGFVPLSKLTKSAIQRMTADRPHHIITYVILLQVIVSVFNAIVQYSDHNASASVASAPGPCHIHVVTARCPMMLQAEENAESA